MLHLFFEKSSFFENELNNLSIARICQRSMRSFSISGRLEEGPAFQDNVAVVIDVVVVTPNEAGAV